MPFPEFNRIAECRYGKLIYNRHDVYIGRSLELYGEFSQGEADLFERIIRPGSTIVEVGANIGAHTLRLAQLATATGQVIAFEPQRVLYQTLCGNMALNSVTNAICVHAAVGHETGWVTVPNLDYGKENNFGGLSLTGYTHGEQVQLTTVDQIGLKKCDFLKIDVEGMEEDVLQGARQTIARLQPFIYVECDRPQRELSLQRFLSSLDYLMYWHAPPLFNPKNFLGNRNNVFGNIVSRNMICVKKGGRYQIEGEQPITVESDDHLG